MRIYNLENRSLLSLKQLRDLIAVNPDLTIEEKTINIKGIDEKLHARSIENALVQSADFDGLDDE